MSFENNSFESKDDLNKNNEIKQKVPTLEQMSDFFEYNFFEIENFQNSYEAFSTEQKSYIEKSFELLNEEYSQEFTDAILNADGLPYNDESFEVFKNEIDQVLISQGFDSSSWALSNNTGNWYNENDIIQKIKATEDKDQATEDKDQVTNWVEFSNYEKKEKISALSSKIRESYSIVEIDGKMVDEIYQGLEGEWYEKDKKFIEKYWAKLLAYVQEHRSPEEFNSLYSDLKTAQEVYGLEIAWLKPLNEYTKATEIPKTPGWIEVVKYWLDTSKFHISRVEWDSLIYGEQKIDFGENPPVKYIKNGNFELKSTELDYKVDKQLRSEIFVLENSLEGKKEYLESVSDEKSIYENFIGKIWDQTEFDEASLQYFEKQFTSATWSEVENAMSESIDKAIDNYRSNPNEETLQNLKISLTKKIQFKLSNIREIEKTFSTDQARLDQLKLQLETKQEQFTQQVLERDEVAKSRLKILQNMTQGSVDQAPLEEIFTEMNESSLQIDIWNGMIVSGFDLDTFEISGSGIPQWIHEDISNKKNDEIIARMMNVMFSGNPDQPIDLETIYTWMPVFKDESWEDISSTFSDNMRNKLWLDPRKYMRDNIEKYNSWESVS